MAIKILKRNYWRKICEECGTEFLFEKEDVVMNRTGKNTCEEFVECPVCGRAVYI